MADQGKVDSDWIGPLLLGVGGAVAAGSEAFATLLARLGISSQEAAVGTGVGTAAKDRIQELYEEAQQAADGSLNLDTWGNPATLQRHVDDHASDFGIDPTSENSFQQYVDKANEFYQKFQSEKLPAVEYPNGGEIGVYEPGTNTFGVYNPNGTTQSFYKPTDGIDYFYRQIERALSGGGSVINPLPEITTHHLQ